MQFKQYAAIAAATLMLGSAGTASADTFGVSCAGVVSGSNITWTASSTGGVAPVSFLWGNGATTSPVTVSYGVGSHSISIQGTDASSTVASNSCAATVAAQTPVISSFTATPANIMPGGSAILSWTVANASSTSIDQGIGAVSSTSITVSPSTTTTYTLTAANPAGSVSQQATVTVGTSTSGTSTPPIGGGAQDKIKALLQMIASLQSQLAQLIASHFGGTVDNPGHIPPGQIGKIACMELGRNLKVGDKGDDVRKLQVLLGVSTTGFFGPLTSKAVAKLQADNGIASSTGTVGPMTRGFLSRSCGKGLLKQGDMWNASSTMIHKEHGNDEASSTADEHEASSTQEGHGHGHSGHGDDEVDD